MHSRYAILAAVAALFGQTASAQIAPGQSVVALVPSATATTGEMYRIDHQARTATALTLSATLAGARPNSIYMASGALGYVGTNPLPAPTPGDVYQITIAGTAVTETKLNTTPCSGPNVAQLWPVGNNLYFISQNATNTGGIIQHLPIAGGAVVVDVDLTTVTNYNGLANSLCAIGRDVYVASFDSSTSATVTGCLVKWDTTTNTATVVMQLPKSKLGAVTPSNFGSVWIIPHPDQPGNLAICGVFGDILVVNPTTAAIVSHTFSGFNTSPTAGLTNLLNSFGYDPRTRDFVSGSRDGNVERIADGHSAEKVIPNVGSTPATSSLAALWHIPAATGIDYTNGPGCPGPGGYTLTSADTGLPTSGNAAFRLACYSGLGGAAAALVIGTTDPALDLGTFGFPGCVLRANPTITLGVTLSGTGNGAGQASIPLPIPNNVVGATLYHQWVQAQISPTILLSVSNGRRLTVQ
jgi:hypothetical protein